LFHHLNIQFPFTVKKQLRNTVCPSGGIVTPFGCKPQIKIQEAFFTHRDGLRSDMLQFCDVFLENVYSIFIFLRSTCSGAPVPLGMGAPVPLGVGAQYRPPPAPNTFVPRRPIPLDAGAPRFGTQAYDCLKMQYIYFEYGKECTKKNLA
jgi:hypothetical protein